MEGFPTDFETLPLIPILFYQGMSIKSSTTLPHKLKAFQIQCVRENVIIMIWSEKMTFLPQKRKGNFSVFTPLKIKQLKFMSSQIMMNFNSKNSPEYLFIGMSVIYLFFSCYTFHLSAPYTLSLDVTGTIQHKLFSYDLYNTKQ